MVGVDRPGGASADGRRGRLEETHAAGQDGGDSIWQHAAAPLVGRAAELNLLSGTVQQADLRLVTLVGAPGAGKTRLALAAADNLRGAFRDGVRFVDLSAVRESNQLLPAVAHAVGFRYVGGKHRALDESLKSFLGQRELLLVLDTFEHLLSAASLLADLLAACPGLKALVTSRAPLRVTGEQQVPVPPLAVPDPSHRLPPEELARVPAVQLLSARAKAVDPTWELTQANAQDVARLCVHLDGLPLALELAASWLDVLSPHEMVLQLEHALDLLIAREQAPSPRHQTLRAAVGWSYDLLSPREQQRFRQLGVFAGGWDLEACAAVWDGPSARPVDALADLGLLIERHLVIRRDDSTGNTRFALLDTIRAFALEQLKSADELEPTRRRWAEFYVALASRAEVGFDGPEQAGWLERLERDRENLAAVLAWCRQSDAPETAEVGLRLGAALWFFWDVRGHIREGRAPLRELLALPAAQARTSHRARALQAAAWLAYLQADVVEVERLAEESLAIARELRDTAVEARTLAFLGTTLALHTDQLARTRELLASSLELARGAADTWTIGTAWFSLGMVAVKEGDVATAWSSFQECLHGSQASGNLWGMACALFRLGALAAGRGNLTDAVRLEQESLRLNWSLRNHRVIALNLELLACYMDTAQDPELQVQLFGAASALFESTEYPLPPTLVPLHERATTAARVALGRRFEQAWNAGQSLSLDQVLELAGRLSFPRTAGLSDRELEVARLVARGLTDREIADQLAISPHTVDNHLRHIFAKLNLSTRAALAAWVVRAGVPP